MSHSPALPTDVLYRFREFVVDPAIGRLHCGLEEVPLTKKTFEVLDALVRHEGRLVDKEQLFGLIWPDTVVEDNNLARCVSMLRKALRARDHGPEFVITVAGRGYQFGVAVERVRRADLSEWFEALAMTPASQAARSAAQASREVTASRVGFQHPSEIPVRTSRIAALFRLRRLSWSQALASAGVIAVGATVLAWGVNSPEAAVDRDRRLWQFTSLSGLEVEPTWSPDGRFLAYSSNRDGNFDIWTQSVLGGTPMRLTSAEAPESQPAWSPDGRLIAFRSEDAGGGLFLVSAFGGVPRKLTDFGQQPLWSPDGSKLLFYLSRRPMKNRAFVATLDGKPPREIFAGALDELNPFRLAWHPDGRRVSVLGRDQAREWTFFTAAVDGGSKLQSTISPALHERLKMLGVELGRFVWARDGGSILVEGRRQRAQNIYRVSIDPTTLEWMAEPTPLTTSTNVLTDIALSPDGRRLAFTSRVARTRAWSFPLGRDRRTVSGDGEPITPEATDTIKFDVSPDGERLAYWTERNGQHELWVRSIRDKREKLESIEAEAPAIRWSRDGGQIAYARNPGADDRSAVVILSVAGQREHAVPSVGSLQLVDWLSPQSWLFGCPDGPRKAICSMDVTPGPLSRLKVVAADSNRSLFGGRMSPDRRWIAFIARADASRSSVHLMPAGGGDWTELSEDSHTYTDKARWSADGSTVYFLSDRQGTLNVWGRDVDPYTGQPVGASFQVTTLDTSDRFIPERLTGLQMALTEDRLIVPLTTVSGAVWVFDNFDQ